MVQSPKCIFDLNCPSYQVAVLSSPITFPYSHLTHCYFAMKCTSGKFSRIEVLGYLATENYSNSQPSLDRFEVHKGLDMFAGSGIFRYNPTLIGKVKGSRGSLTHKMFEFLHREDLTQIYPFAHQYNPLGANSNTFVQWVLNKFSQAQIELPSSAYGKDYEGLRDLEDKLYRIAAE